MRLPRLTSFLAALCLLMPACSDEGAPPSLEDVRSEIQPTQQSWDVHYVISETGGENDASLPRIEILAYHMATYETDDSTYTVMRGDTTGDRVVAYLYNEVGDSSATVHADRLILHEKDRRFEARGGVVVYTPDSKTLESEHLVWLEDDRSIRTPGFVRIRTPKERIQGYNLVADEDLEPYSLARVTGLVEIEEDEDTDEMDPSGPNTNEEDSGEMNPDELNADDEDTDEMDQDELNADDEDTDEMDPDELNADDEDTDEMDPDELNANDGDSGETDAGDLNTGDEDATDTERRDADADGAVVARPDDGAAVERPDTGLGDRTGSGDRDAPLTESKEEG